MNRNEEILLVKKIEKNHICKRFAQLLTLSSFPIFPIAVLLGPAVGMWAIAYISSLLVISAKLEIMVNEEKVELENKTGKPYLLFKVEEKQKRLKYKK